ncbi:MAG: elongation factor G, partial [Quisquiliibacterium sp.]
MREGHLIPVMFTSASTGAGVSELMHILATLAPDPTESNPPQFYRGDVGSPDTEAFDARADEQSHVIAHVFKIRIDPYMGRIACFRVFQGSMRRDMQLFVGDARRAFK